MEGNKRILKLELIHGYSLLLIFQKGEGEPTKPKISVKTKERIIVNFTTLNRLL
jgi:hypothetical protein